MPCLLVTGATGFIGSQLVKRLAETSSYELIALVRQSSDSSEIMPYAKIVVSDGSYTSIANIFRQFAIDLVVHLAAYASYDTDENIIDDLLTSNLVFGTYLLQAMSESGCKKMLNTGTYWQHFSGKQYDPVSLYAALKQGFESIIQYYVQAHQFVCTTLKLTDVYGPKDTRKKILNLMLSAADENTILNVSECSQEVNLLYIDDAVAAYHHCIEKLLAASDASADCYFVHGPETVQLKKIIHLFQSLNSGQPKVNFGARQTRLREIVSPYLGCLPPGWLPKTTVTEGLKKMIGEKEIE